MEWIEALPEVASTCERAIKRWRQQSWTAYARNPGNFRTFNFGIGLEPAVVCLGCRRYTPTALITGDHIVPKSDKNALRKAIAYKQDGIDEDVYRGLLDLRRHDVNPGDEDLVSVIKRYDYSLDRDLRNIQPLCSACNAKKGPRDNVDLFPEDANPIFRRPHEAPF